MVGGAWIIANHFGTFAVSDHPTDEPPRRFRAEGEDPGPDADRAGILPVGVTRGS